MLKKCCLALMFCLLVSVPSFAASTIDTAVVFVTPSGKKYHVENCRTLSKSKEVWKIKLKDANSNGYTECYVCKPLQEIRRKNLSQ